MDRRDRRKVQDPRIYGGSRAVRWDRCDYAGDEIIHLTICADTGAPFVQRDVAQMVCESIVQNCELRRYRLFGYCLLPDHLHVLLSPQNSGLDVGGWLQAFKSYTGHAYVRQGGLPPLWQRSAYDHVCREEETAETVLRYIADNPVRKNLVSDWREWPWTDVFVEI
jgi:putative transposase